MKRTDSYKYTGTTFNSFNIIIDETRAKTQTGNKTYFALRQWLQSNYLSYNTKL